MQKRSTFCFPNALITSSARRMMLELNEPARPRSEVTTTTAIRFTSRTSSSGNSCLSTSGSSDSMTPERRSAYGRACSILSWALRILAAATIFIALVTCWILLTDRIRSRISFRFAISTDHAVVINPFLNSLTAFLSDSSPSVSIRPLSLISLMTEA